MLYITFGENVVIFILIGVATQPRTGVFNHLVVKLMNIYLQKRMYF
jgi:hypothetical protein